jgi:glucose/mannose transport system substrate-binding protein
LAFGELQSPVTAGAITDVVTNFMSSNEDAKEGVRKLAAAAKVK